MATTSQNEAARELIVTLRLGNTPVKSENEKKWARLPRLEYSHRSNCKRRATSTGSPSHLPFPSHP